MVLLQDLERLKKVSRNIHGYGDTKNEVMHECDLYSCWEQRYSSRDRTCTLWFKPKLLQIQAF